MLIKGRRVTWACAPVVGRPARSGPGISASVARGGRSWRAGSTVSGSGRLRRLRRQAPTGGSGGERCAGEAGEAVRPLRPGGAEERASGPARMGRAELGQAGGGGPSAEVEPWDRAGPAGRGKGKGGGPGRGWVGLRVWAGVLGLGSFSISIYSLFSILIQTKVEFKYQFEFKPHSIN